MAKKFLTIISAALFLALSACSQVRDASAEELITLMRTQMLETESLTLSANIRADYGERVYDFKLTFEGSPDAGVVTILEPEAVAGVSARMSDGGAALIWDGAEIETGPLPGGLSPAGMIPALITEWREGYMDAFTLENGALIVESEISPGVRQTTWFDAETLTPERGEILDNGRVFLTAEFLPPAA